MTPQSTSQGSSSNQQHNIIGNTSSQNNPLGNQLSGLLHKSVCSLLPAPYIHTTPAILSLTLNPPPLYKSQSAFSTSLSGGASSQQYSSAQTGSLRQQSTSNQTLGSHQQQLQGLPNSGTLSQGSSLGLAATGAGGGGGSGGSGQSSSGTSLTKIVTAQLSLLLSTLKENNWEQQVTIIRQVSLSSMGRA